MKFENTRVMNFGGALRGMRNPKESWNRSDTTIEVVPRTDSRFTEPLRIENTDFGLVIDIGHNDMLLAQTLIRGGSEHRKFLRQILVSVDITAPMYWWSEADTYKIGTVANSTSKMHKVTSKPITIDSFEHDDYNSLISESIGMPQGEKAIIDYCEVLRQVYLSTKDKKYWKELIRFLPESWLQKRTITMNYENLYGMYHQRKNHKLNEWSGMDDPANANFIAWVKSLPYSEEFIWNVDIS